MPDHGQPRLGVRFVPLHGVIKKRQKLATRDLDLARRRMKEVRNA